MSEETKNEEVTIEDGPISAAAFVKGIKNQITTLKPQVDLMELKARFSKANYDNMRYIIELEGIYKPSVENVTESKTTEEESTDRKEESTGLAVAHDIN